MPKTNKKSGFTVIELLLVMAILNLLATLLFASFKGANDKALVARGMQFSANVKNVIGIELLGEYLFENSLSLGADTSGYNNNATTINAVSQIDNDASLEMGKAANFNGSSYMLFFNMPLLCPANITLEVWAKADELVSTLYGILSNKYNMDYGAGIGIGRATQFGSTMNPNYVIGVGIASWSSGDHTAIRTSWSPVANKWYHIVFTHNSVDNLNILYVNGREEGKVTGALDYRSGSGYPFTTLIGSYYPTAGRFRGAIDGVRIYGSALTSSQVKKNYAEGIKSHQIAEK